MNQTLKDKLKDFALTALKDECGLNMDAYDLLGEILIEALGEDGANEIFEQVEGNDGRFYIA